MHTTLIYLLGRSSTPGDFQHANSVSVPQAHHLIMKFFPIRRPACEDRGCVFAIPSGHRSGLDLSTTSPPSSQTSETASLSPEGKSKEPEFSWFRLLPSGVIDKKIGNNVDEVRTQGEEEGEEDEGGCDPEEDGEQDERDERLEEADVRRIGEQHRVSGSVWQASVVTAINRQAT